jgi:uncharacterized membrane protein
MAEPRETPAIEHAVARMLQVGTYLSMLCIGLGVVGMIATGTSPLSVAPDLDPGRLPADLIALRPSGFLWLGLVGVIATPAARVAAAIPGYLRTGERAMALVGIMVLIVIALGVLLGVVSAGGRA